MKKVLGRILIVLPAVILQVLWYLLVLGLLNNLFHEYFWDALNIVLSVLAVVFVTGLIAKRDESSYKLLWVMVIVAMPILGTLLYFFLGNKSTGKRLKKKLERATATLPKPCDQAHIEEIQRDDLRLGQTLSRISQATGFPIVKNGTSKYYSFGEEMFQDMCRDLQAAQDYIYVEYFIIQSGKFWDTLADIMAQKVKEGVDVRVMYDDLGSIGTFSVTDVLELKKKGIKCIPFNPFLFIKSQLNNRDHRKIMVIDGKIAYSGGINLADEYINEVERFGYWMDCAVILKGEAVNSFVAMFCAMWRFTTRETLDLAEHLAENHNVEANGYVLPYCDDPLSERNPAEGIYMQILNTARDYVYITSPYLIIDSTMITTLRMAAKSGVDVRIITPNIPDKWYVHPVTQYNYLELLEAGVRIYEYTPGFIHSKLFVSDDMVATIGTVNMDYRSFIMHFECGVWMYGNETVTEIKEHFNEILGQSKEIKLKEWQCEPWYRRLKRAILHLFAPFL